MHTIIFLLVLISILCHLQLYIAETYNIIHIIHLQYYHLKINFKTNILQGKVSIIKSMVTEK